MSDFPLRFRSPIFRKIDGQIDSEFGALNEYSELTKIRIINVTSKRLPLETKNTLQIRK